jgi:predicted HicB family RNase H-like nuclease
LKEKDRVLNFCLKGKLDNFASKLQKTITTKIKAILRQCQSQIGPKNAFNGIYLVKVDKIFHYKLARAEMEKENKLNKFL